MIFTNNLLKASSNAFNKTSKVTKNLFLKPTQLCFSFGQSLHSQKRQKEAKLARKLKQGLSPVYLSVNDTTIGVNSCGQMYKIIIESQKFIGKSLVAQHQMVSECIREQMKNIHAVNIKTKVPASGVEPEPEAEVEVKVNKENETTNEENTTTQTKKDSI